MPTVAPIVAQALETTTEGVQKVAPQFRSAVRSLKEEAANTVDKLDGKLGQNETYIKGRTALSEQWIKFRNSEQFQSFLTQVKGLWQTIKDGFKNLSQSIHAKLEPYRQPTEAIASESETVENGAADHLVSE